MPDRDDLKTTLDDALSYPILTTESSATASRSPSSGTASSAPLGQTVEAALRDVLAWRPNAGDARGFVSALNQAFTAEALEGRTHWRWTPRSYAVQHDMGAVTGAQASLYARAKVALEHALPLLEKLYPLRADDDDEDTSAIRALVRSELSELVNELGQVGGPRVQRVDAQFAALLGEGATGQPERVGGLLGTLRETFGLERPRVNTISEEENLTNFLIIADHTLALKSTWDSQKRFFVPDDNNDAFLGTHLVLLSRALAVVAESVREAYFAMDSVFLGPAERQTTRLALSVADRARQKAEVSRLTIAELLGWVERFALEEGPRMVRDAGKSGVFALGPTLDTLIGLVGAAERLAKTNSANPTPGFHTPRVRRAWEELLGNLEGARELTRQLRRAPRPEVTMVEPNRGTLGRAVRVDIEGLHFREGAKVKLVYSSEGDPMRVKTLWGEKRIVFGDTALGATFDLRSDEAAEGRWRVVVEDTDGGVSQEEVWFRIQPPPAPLRLEKLERADKKTDRAEGHPGERLSVAIYGSGLQERAHAYFGPFIEVIRRGYYPSSLEVDLHILDHDEVFKQLKKSRGGLPVSVTVTNPDGSSDTLKDALTITDPSSTKDAKAASS